MLSHIVRVFWTALHFFCYVDSSLANLEMYDYLICCKKRERESNSMFNAIHGVRKFRCKSVKFVILDTIVEFIIQPTQFSVRRSPQNTPLVLKDRSTLDRDHSYYIHHLYRFHRRRRQQACSNLDDSYSSMQKV